MAGVQSSGWVSLLLGTFYAVIGALHILGDHWQDTEALQTGQTIYRKQTVPYVMASVGYELQLAEAKLRATMLQHNADDVCASQYGGFAALH